MKMIILTYNKLQSDKAFCNQEENISRGMKCPFTEAIYMYTIMKNSIQNHRWKSSFLDLFQMIRLSKAFYYYFKYWRS